MKLPSDSELHRRISSPWSDPASGHIIPAFTMSKAQILDKLSTLLDRVCDMSSEEDDSPMPTAAQAAGQHTAAMPVSSHAQAQPNAAAPAANAAPGEQHRPSLPAEGFEAQQILEVATPSAAPAASSPASNEAAPLSCPPSARSAAPAASAAEGTAAGAALQAADMGIRQRAVESPRTGGSVQLQPSLSSVELAEPQREEQPARTSRPTAGAEGRVLATPASASARAGKKHARTASPARNTPGSSAGGQDRPVASGANSGRLVRSSVSASRRNLPDSRPLIGIPVDLRS